MRYNYIHRLQAMVEQGTEETKELRKRLSEFLDHVCSDKFRGVGLDGDRKDWIAIADVLRWISYISDAGNNVKTITEIVEELILKQREKRIEKM